jgi:acetylornithine deacetylase/succinyl-diaminopimelate desuccinylase-like protein
MHGINERLAVESLVKMVQFFGELIPSWTANQ